MEAGNHALREGTTRSRQADQAASFAGPREPTG
jgi:hypothetical protein